MNHVANGAIDKDFSTMSHTRCGFNTDLWFNMKFIGPHCFSEVFIANHYLTRHNGPRMNDTQVYVLDTEEGTEYLCGILKIREVWTVEGQTYRWVPECPENCTFWIMVLNFNQSKIQKRKDLLKTRKCSLKL